jgi:hypothetical protein
VGGVGCGRREVWPAKNHFVSKNFEAAMEGSEGSGGNKLGFFLSRLLHK